MTRARAVRARTLLEECLRVSASPAVIEEGHTRSHADIERLSRTVAEGLAGAGAGPGDRVGLALGNSSRFVAALLGTWRVGAVPVPVAVGMPPEKLSFILEQVGAAGLIGEDPALERLAAAGGAWGRGRLRDLPGDHFAACGWLAAPTSERRPGGAGEAAGTAVILFTSGTSGRPKGVRLSYANLDWSTRYMRTALRLTADDRTLVATDYSHCAGLLQVLVHLRCGGSVVAGPSMAVPASLLEAIRSLGVTGFPCVPSTALVLSTGLREAFVSACAGLRFLELSSAPCPPGLAADLAAALPRVGLFNTYGLTEAPRVTYLDLRADPEGRASIGRENPSTSVDVAGPRGGPATAGEAGVLTVRGPTVALGYWNRPDQQDRFADGFSTGDVGYRDDRGRLVLIGRRDEMIKCGAYRVYPREVEAVLERMENVLEAGVYGAPEPLYGEVVRAKVVLRGGLLDECEMLRFCRRHLEPSHVPRAFEVCDALPRTAAGKLDRAALRRPAGATADAT